jgi:hypothetical protein
MKDHGILIDDTPRTQKRFDGENGTQTVRIPTDEDDVFFDVELNIVGGLSYFKMQPPTKEQLDDVSIPHVHLTSDMDWDPAKYDDAWQPPSNTFEVNEAFSMDDPNAYDCELFFKQMESMDPFGTSSDTDDDEFYEYDELDGDDDASGPEITAENPFYTVPNVIAAVASVTRNIEAKLTYVEHKYGKTLEELRPNFAWASTERIKASLEASTQFFRATQWSKKIKRHFKSRFPGANVERINEVVCTDTAFLETDGQSDGISGHGGAIGFQLFVGNESRHLAVYPVRTDSDFPAVLGEYIRTHGAPTKLFSDNAKAQQSAKVKEILRNFAIADASSEPHYQNQNAAEREIQDVKKDMENVMNLTNTPYEWWPLCVEYIVMVKNHTARTSLKDRTPIEKRTGQTPDVSKLLQFRWWEPVYFLDEHGTECLGRWAGVAEHVGDELTFIVSPCFGPTCARRRIQILRISERKQSRRTRRCHPVHRIRGVVTAFLQLDMYQTSAQSKKCILMHPMISSVRRLFARTMELATLSVMKSFGCSRRNRKRLKKRQST